MLGSASASASEPVRVWHRSSEGCPDAEAFVVRLAELGRAADVAGVGDRVDFVVTLAAGASESEGRLERQTERGTVALRTLSAPSCLEVAEALALSLDLAVAGEALQPAAAGSAQEPALATAGAPDVAGDDPPRPALDDSQTPAASAWLGAGARAVSGMTPDMAYGASAFVDVDVRERRALGIRAAVIAVRGAGRARGVELSMARLAGRLEACALALSLAAVQLSPCVAGELGVVDAEAQSDAGRRDLAPWASVGGLLRTRAPLASAWVVELDAGLSVPIWRYELGAAREQEAVYRMAPVGLELGVSLSLGL